MTSSPAAMPPPYEAVVRRGDQATGPIRLPLYQPEQFIKEFNHVYHDHNMLVVATPSAPSTNDLIKTEPPETGN